MWYKKLPNIPGPIKSTQPFQKEVKLNNFEVSIAAPTFTLKKIRRKIPERKLVFACQTFSDRGSSQKSIPAQKEPSISEPKRWATHIIMPIVAIKITNCKWFLSVCPQKKSFTLYWMSLFLYSLKINFIFSISSYFAKYFAFFLWSFFWIWTNWRY